MTELEKYYGKFNEEHRLTTRHGTVEFSVTMEKIHEFIELSGAKKIADIGAGTGRYSVALSKEGFDVTAVELVQRNLDVLLSKHEKVKCWKGDARNLSFLPDETFDITLLFGPLYHLHGTEDKLKAMNEAKRITKKGGYILAAYVQNEYAVITYCFLKNKVKECLENKSLSKDFNCADLNSELYCYMTLSEIEKLNEMAGLKRVKVFSPDGPADYIRKELNAMDEETFKLFVEYQKAKCELPELLGAGSHLVDVLQKE